MPIAEELSRLHSANIDIGTLSLISKLSTKIAIRSMFGMKARPIRGSGAGHQCRAR